MRSVISIIITIITTTTIGVVISTTLHIRITATLHIHITATLHMQITINSGQRRQCWGRIDVKLVTANSIT